MKYKLIASDLDGTLLNSSAELTERSRVAIVRAVEAGFLFVTATGRPFCNTRVINDLFTESQDMPFIVFNGSAAYMGKSGTLLFEKFLDFELAAEAFEIGQSLGIAQIVWTGARLWCNRECEETIRYRDFSTLTEMSVAEDLRAAAIHPGISKVLWIADPDFIAAEQRKMKKHFAKRLDCYSSLPHYLEFVSNEASKGSALKHISQLNGIDKGEIAAFGDSYNDISMLEYAGFSVAVSNAPDEIKKVCDHVSASNDEDGVAEVIERLMGTSKNPE